MAHPYIKQTGDRQLAALLASRVAASVLLLSDTAKLILIRDQRSVVSTAQSITVIIGVKNLVSKTLGLRHTSSGLIIHVYCVLLDTFV